MASTTKSLRSSTANKRPTTAIADGQIALNTNAASPGLYFKDSTGAAIIKIGPVHVGTTAPNVSPGAGGSTGNSTGEAWLDTSLTPNGWKVWTGAAWLNATPAGSATVQGLLELATDAETQAGSDTARAVTPAGLQSKMSDSVSTTSSTTIASSTAVKSANDLATAALPKSGGTVTGNLEIGATGSLTFEGATADAFETTLAVVDPTADRTITLPNATGTVVLDNNAQTVQFGLGAVGTPSITFIGDTNTGIYSPAADTLAFAEGGVEAMRIDSSGKVGIGVTDPGSPLEVQSDSGGTGIRIRGRATANTATLRFFANNGTTQQAKFEVSDNTLEIGSLTSVPLVVSTNNTERLRVTAAGLVGIGTSAVSELLHIKGGSSAGLDPTVLIANGAPATSETGSIDFGFNSQAADPDVLGRISTTITNRTSGAQASTLSFGVASSGSLATRMTLTGTGLGIGTTSPGYPLDVVSGASAWGLNIRGRSADNIAYIRFSPNSGATTYAAIGTPTANTLGFDVNESERLRIDSSGRLLVGTSTASTNCLGQFESSISGLLSVRRNLAGAGGPSLLLAHTRGAAGTYTSLTNGDELGTIEFRGADGAQDVAGAYIQAYVDGTPGTNDMPGRLVFSTTADGASTPTERMRISQNGYINFATTTETIHNTTTTGFSYRPGMWASVNSDYESLLLTQQNTTAWVRFYYQNTGEKGSITYNGSGTNYNTSSDYRLKENVVPLAGAIGRLQQISVHRFNFISDPDRTVDGFIAHEAQEVVPECVTGEKDAVDVDGNPVYQGIDQSKLVPLLTAALQEAIAKIETLETRLTAAGIE
jgi:hypothetical protein